MNNLQDKWRDSFDFLDMNNDSVLDMDDIKFVQDNYVRLHNLTQQEVNKSWYVTKHCKSIGKHRHKERIHTDFFYPSVK